MFAARILTAFCLPALVLSPTLCAQDDPSRLSIDRLHTTGDFGLERFGPARWLDDGSYATLERAPGGGRDLVRYDPATGARSVMVAAKDLVPTGRKRPLSIDDYSFDASMRHMLIFTNTRKVWRYNTRGDYWTFDRDTKALRKLGGPAAPEASLMFAKFSPDASRVGYVRANDIWVEDVTTGSIARLTNTGTDDIVNGTFDWVYEEEFGQRDGFRWSPDGRRIAYWQIEKTGVGVFKIVNNLEGQYATITEIPYPKVGTTNPAARVGVVDAGGGRTTWMKLPDDLRNDYIARMDWAAHDNEVLVQRINRDQNVNKVMLCDATTGAARTVFVDRDDAWVDAVDDLVWLNDGREFTFVSQRDGWRHLWIVSRDGKQARCVTPGSYDIVELLLVDEAHDRLWFIASPDNATQRFLYRAPLAGGPATRVTPADMGGWHQYSIQPGGNAALHTWSSFDTPNQVELVSLPDHKTAKVHVTNERARKALKALDVGPHEFIQVTSDEGVTMDGWVMYPPNFDATKKWPVIVHVYGEPAGTTVNDRWGGGNFLWHRLLTQQGYVVMSFDNRGTPAPKGRAWRKCVRGKIGIIAPVDQAGALRAAQEKFAWIDAERVGIWGWSGGGSMTLNQLFRYPDLYSAGIAIAFIADQRLYDTIYQERYMGQLKNNPDGFRDGSPITHVRGLKGDLLVVYGTGDDNCHYQNMERLTDALVANNKYFDMLAYPNRSHSIYERRNTRRHLYGSMTRWFLRHLPNGRR